MNEPSDPIRKAFDTAAMTALAVVCVSGAVLRSAESSFARSMGVPLSPIRPLLFGVPTATWATWHDKASLVFIILLLPNLIWARGLFKWLLRRGERSGSFSRAAVGLIALVTAGGWLAGSIRHRLSGGAGTPQQVVSLLGEDSDEKLLGLSLQDIQGRMDVPAEYMRVNLGLPTDVNTTVPLAELMKKYSFNLREVRGVIFMHRMNSKAPISAPSPVPSRPF